MKERKRGEVKLRLCLWADNAWCFFFPCLRWCNSMYFFPDGATSRQGLFLLTMSSANTVLSLSSSRLYFCPFLSALLGNSPNDAPNSQVSNPGKLKPGFLLKTPLQKTLKQILFIFLQISEPGNGSVFLFYVFDAPSSRTVLLKHMPSAWTTLSCFGCYWTFPQMVATDTFLSTSNLGDSYIYICGFPKILVLLFLFDLCSCWM